MRLPTSDFRSPTSVLAGLRVSFLAGTLGQGGAERQLYYIVKSLRECGAEVSLLSLTQGEFWEEPIRQLGVPIFPMGGSESRFLRLTRILATLRRLRPVVVQSQHFYTNAYAGLAGRLLRTRSIGAVRNDGASEVKANGPLWGRLSAALPQLLAANSQRGISNLVGMGFSRKKFAFLPNVVDTSHFRPSLEARPDRPFTVLGVGRLVEQKRFDLFIQSVALAAKQCPRPLRAIIAGAGPLRASLERLAGEATGPGVRVEFVGLSADPLALYHSADCFLLTSDWEGTPNVVLEAMACGLPTVATRVGGVEDMLTDQCTGLLVEPSNAAAAAHAVTRIAADRDLGCALRGQALALVAQVHAWKRLADHLVSLYRTAAIL